MYAWYYWKFKDLVNSLWKDKGQAYVYNDEQWSEITLAMSKKIWTDQN